MHETMLSYNASPDPLFDRTEIAIYSILLPEIEFFIKMR